VNWRAPASVASAGVLDPERVHPLPRSGTWQAAMFVEGPPNFALATNTVGSLTLNSMTFK
jgi:hypothetical protein